MRLCNVFVGTLNPTLPTSRHRLMTVPDYHSKQTGRYDANNVNRYNCLGRSSREADPWSSYTCVIKTRMLPGYEEVIELYTYASKHVPMFPVATIVYIWTDVKVACLSPSLLLINVLICGSHLTEVDNASRLNAVVPDTISVC